MDGTAIHARGLRKEFTARKRVTAAVGDIDLDVAHGETIGYIGPNGAGKSTTLKMMTGILAPTSGEVRVCGLDPVPRRRRLARRIGVVFGQRSQLWWDLPLRDSFRLLRHVHAVDGRAHARRLEECRETLGLGEFWDTPVRQLSLGQRMRGEITAALLHGPSVLFLDEPTIGLDVVSKRALRAFLADLGARGDTTLVLTTHDLADIERLCPRLVVVDHGRIVHDGSLEALHARYGSRRRVVAVLDARDAWDARVPVDEVAGAGVESVEELGDGRRRVVFALEGAEAGALVAALARGGGLRDVSVLEPDIEDVVARVYTGSATVPQQR